MDTNDNNLRSWILVGGVLLIVLVAAWVMVATVRESVLQARQSAEQMLAPVDELASGVGTQVARALNPTPTVLPDPMTIIHNVRSLARLETIQYSVEKVITAETGQDIFAPLFGDRLLFVAHGIVIAGVDLQKLSAQDLWVDKGVLYVRLPDAEIFIATLDNEKSYVYDRQTGLLANQTINLETLARQAAEEEIRQAALEDGILTLAQQNAENFLQRLLRDLGYPDVFFVQPTPSP